MNSNEAFFIRGTDGRDLFIGGDLADVIVGGDGVDTLIGGAGDDLIVGDRVIPGQNFSVDFVDLRNGSFEVYETPELLMGGAGDDTLVGAGWDDSIIDDGNFSRLEIFNPDVVITISPSPLLNQIWGGEGDDSIFGGPVGDTLGGGKGDDFIEGGESSDLVFGGGDNDTIQGAGGDDSIWGASGNDILSGGEGADVFFFAEGHGQDYIQDFDIANDALFLTHTVAGFFSRVDSDETFALTFETKSIDGVSGLLLSTGPDDSVFLVGLTAAEFENLTIIT